MTVIECAAAVLLLAVLQRCGAGLRMRERPVLTINSTGCPTASTCGTTGRALPARQPARNPRELLLLGLAISAALAALSYYAIERWALRSGRDAREPAPRAAEPRPRMRRMQRPYRGDSCQRLTQNYFRMEIH